MRCVANVRPDLYRRYRVTIVNNPNIQRVNVPPPDEFEVRSPVASEVFVDAELSLVFDVSATCVFDEGLLFVS